MLARECGNLVIGGFAGPSLPETFARALRRGERGGAVLFKRNLEGGPVAIAALVRSVRSAAGEAPLVAVDQEGGRVARLGPPFLAVPPMRTVASWDDLGLAEHIARAVGVELAALGFTTNFAPVLDVDTCADNPIIGDRSFGDDPDACARFGVAWVRGLQGAGLLACGKHFPGHGDTSKDSHLELPEVNRPRADLERTELAPFRAAAAAGVASMMTAHVVYSSIDPSVPATLSRSICTDLRSTIGFEGILFSDDLEMGAIANRWSVDDAAVLAVAAGCDAVLVCASEDAQQRAFAALVREAETSPAFRARCKEASGRVLDGRGRASLGPLDDEAIARVLGGPESRRIAAAIAARGPRRPRR